MSKAQEITLTGNSYGFRIAKDDRDHLFKGLITQIKRYGFIIEFPAGEAPRLSLKTTPSFWEDWPPIFPHAEIKAWMKKRGDAPWPKGKPPKYIAKLSRAGTKVGPIKIKILRRINEVEPVKMPAPEQPHVTEQEIALTGHYWGAKYSRRNPNGFRISPEVARDLFIPLKSRLNQKGVIIEFPSGEAPRLSLDVIPSFWDHCHEFRIPAIGAWMKKRGDAPWPEGEPPKYTAKLSTAGTGAIKIKILPDEQAEEGIEWEQEEEQISHPFKPEEIRIHTFNFTIDQIVSRLDHKEIILTPSFQRRLDIWKPVDRSRLIESLLLRIPIPVFYVAADKNEVWSVVDGLQRTSTIYDYIKNEFPLKYLEYLTGLSGNCYKDLSRPMQRRISETQLIVNVIEPGTPEEVMFNIFRRINTGGLKLNGQEIRHALNPGPVLNYLEKLARTKEFLEATDSSISRKRMADEECILRFLAFHVDPWEEYSTYSLDRHLGGAMRKINNMDKSERDRLSADFKKAMCAAHNILGEYAFRKQYNQRDKRRPINKALFESWSVGLARCSDEEIKIIVKNRKKIVRDFISCMNDDYDFYAAISASTGDPVKVRKRFQVIDKIINRGISHAS